MSRPSFVAQRKPDESASQTGSRYSAWPSWGVTWTTSPLSTPSRNRFESPLRSPACPATTQRPSGEISPDGAQAAELEAPLLPALESPHHDVEVEAVAAIRRICEQRAVARDVRRAVDVARIHDQRVAVEIELRPLVPALVDLEEEAVVREELPVDRLGVARQLLELTTADRQPIELARPREVRRDEQPRAVARPRQRVGLPQLEQRPQIRHDVRLSAAARRESRRARG